MDRADAGRRWPALGPTLAGVLSLLALDEAPLTGYPAVPGGLAATLALVQALGDAGGDGAAVGGSPAARSPAGPDEVLTGSGAGAGVGPGPGGRRWSTRSAGAG